ncbi:hypothetical protein HPB50_022111 [Hyalomma asiaticum]|uniref:Uncharacterized protein n=1 Tax=Hyalomma asiaticum TaxID=266040 RepID=A0ACB7TLZ7_HYAAI|nr:hypothetical protein HPB50_022111 [Hyalomma asiaticum]
MATKVARAPPRKRFTPSDDRAILEEVVAVNPFRDSSWCDVAERISCVLGRQYSTRSVKERVDLLLAQFLRSDARNRRKSGTEEDYKAVDALLQNVADLARECGYRPPRSAVRKHRCRGAPKADESACAPQRATRLEQSASDGCLAAALEAHNAETATSDYNMLAPATSGADDDPDYWSVLDDIPPSPEARCT